MPLKAISFLIYVFLVLKLFSQQDPVRKDHFDNSAYFAFNETKVFENLTLETLQDILEKHPDICIEFRQTIHPMETKRVANRRMRQFLKTLKQAGVDPANFQINSSLLYVHKDDPEQRSRIQGIIISMDDKCH